MPLSQFYPVQHDPCTGEPYIRLPVPFERFTITPPRREDVPHIIRILNDDPVKRWIDGLPFPYLEEHAEEWVAATLEKSDAVLHELRIAEEEQPDGPPVAVSGCPVNCLRRTEEDGSQWFAGVVEFNRSYFPDVRDRTVQDRLISRNESRKAGDEEIVWCVGYYLRSELHGRGIMTCALRTLMRTWAIPRMKARHVRAETIVGNWASIRVLEKLGFRIRNTVAIRRVTSAGQLIKGYHVLWWEMTLANPGQSPL